MEQPQPADLEGLVLAGPIVGPTTGALPRSLRVVADRRLFRSLLINGRPRVVVLYAPPATSRDIDVVAAERRRRGDMRAVLVDRPTDCAERLAALRAGFDEALDDTVALEELSGRLALLGERARTALPTQRLAIGPGVELDVEARQLLTGETQIHLRPREAALLEVLARTPGRIFSRSELLDLVGARAHIHDVRTIDVHMRWLRAKLAAHPRVAARLATVRGVGYRLEVSRSVAPESSVNTPLTERQRDVDGRPEDWLS